METVQLDVTKEECEEACPLPLDILPDIIDGIEKVEAGETVTIAFDENEMTEDELLAELEERGYNTSR